MSTVRPALREVPLADGRSTRVDQNVFRRAAGQFGTGICIISTRCRELDYAMTVNAFTSVSLEPLQVLVCVDVSSRMHAAVLEAGAWGASILDGRAGEVSRRLARRGRCLKTQLDGVPHHRGEATGMALIDQSLATMECRTTAVLDCGDHSVIVGEVLSVDCQECAEGPLLFFQGHYCRL